MTREEARKAAEVMLAYANGEEVETLSLNGKHVFIKTPSFNWGEREYRVKRKSTFRPFKDMEECWNEMLKHKPFGWLRLDDMYINIVCVQSVDKQIELSPENLKFEEDAPADIKRMFISFERAFNEYLFADGTPFGIKEE